MYRAPAASTRKHIDSTANPITSTECLYFKHFKATKEADIVCPTVEIRMQVHVEVLDRETLVYLVCVFFGIGASKARVRLLAILGKKTVATNICLYFFFCCCHFTSRMSTPSLLIFCISTLSSHKNLLCIQHLSPILNLHT